MNQVIDFIIRRFNNDCNWLNGNCYYFALILHDRFPNSEIYYDTVNGHFVTKINNEYYDWRGINFHIHESDLIKWEDYKHIDPVHYYRIKDNVLS